MLRVIKVGGNELDDRHFLQGLARAVAGLQGQTMLVHGGGKAIAEALDRYNISFDVVDGMRVTSDAAMEIVEMVLSGATNKRLVTALLRAGVQAIGLSGVDLELIQVHRLLHDGKDLGRVGEIELVRLEVLRFLLEQGWTPVISPVSFDPVEGVSMNVNADLAAQAVAATLTADELIFVTNVPGVLINDSPVAHLTPVQAERYIRAGFISGGMLPKVKAAVSALDEVKAVRITDLVGLRADTGTRFTRGEA